MKQQPFDPCITQSFDGRIRRIVNRVLIRGFDDTFNQMVNARSSYRYDEILWGWRFRPAFVNDEEGHLILDLAKIDDVVKAPEVQ